MIGSLPGSVSARRARPPSRFRRVATRLVKYGLLAVGLLVTAGLSALTTMRVVLGAQEVEVPSLVGKRVGEAGQLASHRDLLLRVEGRRNDPRVAADRIMSQEPLAGSRLNNPTARHWMSATVETGDRSRHPVPDESASGR